VDDRSRARAAPACRERILYWNAIYTQFARDAHPGRPADDELAGLMPALFERVDALGIYTFDADRRAGQLRPLRAA
jgi:hypothetical protein